MKICKVYLAVMMLVSALIVSSCSGGNKQTEKETAANTESAATSEAIGPGGAGAGIDESLPTVIDFYATWCGPCKMIAPLFHSMQEEYAGRINFVSIDVDKDEASAMKYRVEAMPTFVFLDASGNEVNRLVGADPDALRAYVESLAKLK